jgi:hypothetical protein
MSEELHFNVRLEGLTKFTHHLTDKRGEERATSMWGGPEDRDADIDIATVVLIEAGLSSWKDEPYRATIITEFRGGDADDQSTERAFSSSEALCAYLEQHIADLRAKGFVTVRYKANGLPVDWLNSINLPSPNVEQ